MNPKFLELSRSQLSVSWKKSQYNHYSDKRKQSFQKCLETLFDTLMTINFSAPEFKKDDLRFFRKVLEFFKGSLALLDNNTISSVPHEIIECLNTAAKQWMPDFDEYIIVMEDGPYAIKPQVEDVRMFYVSLKAKLGVEFKYILLSVSMPRQLTRDYLTNVCLFHELGHFVDTKFKISEGVIVDVFYLWNGPQKNEIEKWFMSVCPPFLNAAKQGMPPIYISSDYTKFFLMEYFADLFGAQYVDANYLHYLEYLTNDLNADDMMHPSFNKRKAMYEDFCKKPDANCILKLLFEKTLSLTGYGLTKRYVNLDNSDMLGLIPSVLNTPDEMLSIFKMGWDVYKSGSSEIERRNNLTGQLEPDKLYDIVNNLIEKSISNYLTLRDWNKAKSLIET